MNAERLGRWHLLTGVGAYSFMVLVEMLTSADDELVKKRT